MIDTDLLLCWGAIHRKIQKGQVVFHEGDHAQFYYQVESGKVKMVNGNDEGKEFIQGFFHAGESFGEPPLFDLAPYPASAIADEDSILLRLTKESFLHLLKEHVDIHFKFTRLLASRLRFKTILSKEISCFGPAHRILTLIQHYKDNSNIPLQSKFRVDLTRQEIADMTGLRVETVIRALRQLHDKGEVLIEKGKVYC